MRRVLLVLALLTLLVGGLKPTAYACTHPDCVPPGQMRPEGPSDTRR